MVGGWVYALVFVAPEQRVKIGMTSRNPVIRAQELAMRFMERRCREVQVQLWAVRSCDKRAHEQAVLTALGRFRVPGEREVFRAPLDEVRAAMTRVCGAEPERVMP